VPAKKQPPKVQTKVLIRTGEMDDTQLPYIFIDSLVANYHPDLAEAQFIVGYSYGWKPDKEGRITLGKVSLCQPFERQLHGKDIKIILNYNFWHHSETRDDARQAVIDHQLCHPRPQMDKELGIPLKNELNMIMYYIRDHDFADFHEVWQRWGIWQRDLEKTAEVMAQAWEKERADRELKSAEELEEEGADSEEMDMDDPEIEEDEAVEESATVKSR
jgi:hypothetical protein